MQQAFQTAMAPSHSILAGGFYMGASGAVYMKDDIMLSESVIREEEWYQSALEHPNSVTLECYDTTRVRLTWTPQKGKQMVLVTAMATDVTTDTSGEIEVVAFFTTSRAGDVLFSQMRDITQGTSVILDSGGHVLFGDMGNETIREYFEAHPGQFQPGSQTRRAALTGDGERDYFFQTKPIPDTDWTVVTFIEESSLGSGFYRVGGIVALIVEELDMLETYVYLMRIRYSNGFEVSYDVQPDCLDYLLPRLTLQPVVENSITHGFDEMAEELGQIRISEGRLFVSVRLGQRQRHGAEADRPAPAGPCPVAGRQFQHRPGKRAGQAASASNGRTARWRRLTRRRRTATV